MLSSSTSSAGVTVLVVSGAVTAGILFLLIQRNLKSKKEFVTRLRKDYASVEEWLLSDVQRASIDFSKKGHIVSARTSALPEIFDYRAPPVLYPKTRSHLHGLLGRYLSSLLFKDLALCIPPTTIHAPAAQVWECLINFENYPSWNAFHFRVDVVEKPSGRIYLGLNVNLGIVGNICSYEEVYFVDSKRHVLIYGLREELPSSLRVVWVEDIDGKSSVLNSYDMIGGFPALFSKVFSKRAIYDGFCRQHESLKRYVEQLPIRS